MSAWYNKHDLKGLAVEYGTPLYVYHQATIQARAREIDAALAGPTPHLICYAVKANPALAILQTFARMGCGADVTSGGELFRALQAGIPPDKIVFSGVGKTQIELREALAAGIKAIHVESAGELDSLAALVRELSVTAPVTLRVNPDVDPHTHPHIATGLKESKFGIAWEQAPALIKQIDSDPMLRLHGLAAHIGSQITSLEPFKQAADRLAKLARELLAAGTHLEYIDFGGGLGVTYDQSAAPDPAQWAQTLRGTLADLPLQLHVEPGRVLVAEAGILLTEVLYIKTTPAKTFVIIDAGMNDLMRPALYGAHHEVIPVTSREDAPVIKVDIAGPVCESTDILARERWLPLPQPSDLLLVRDAGAYGMSMASQYNSRLRPAEVLLLANGSTQVIRSREGYADLTHNEKPIH